jgi:hypothetical protein
VRLNDEEKGQIDEPDVVLDIATAEAPAKPPTPPMASPKLARMLAFATFQGVIWEMSVDSFRRAIEPNNLRGYRSDMDPVYLGLCPYC